MTSAQRHLRNGTSVHNRYTILACFALVAFAVSCATPPTRILETHTDGSTEEYDLAFPIGANGTVPCMYNESIRCRAYFFPLEIHQPFPWTVSIHFAHSERILTVIVGSGGDGLLVRGNDAKGGFLDLQSHVTWGVDSVEAYSDSLHVRAEGIQKGNPLTVWFHYGQTPCSNIKLCTDKVELYPQKAPQEMRIYRYADDKTNFALNPDNYSLMQRCLF